jgi:sterol desaturase/sphingolipid hydroxylase (fatty acid hydroxylase superfamily)
MSDLILYAIPFFIITVIAEAYLSTKNSHLKFKKEDTYASLAMGIGSVIVGLFTKTAEFGLYVFIYQFSINKIDFSNLTFGLYLVLLFGEDLCYYFNHFMGHNVRFFWASHSNHHSSEYYNLSTALRQTWTGALGGIFWIPLILIGFSPELIFFQRGVSLLYQYWIHTELIDKMGFFELIFNTPSHHRVHHGTNIKYLDKNHAGIFIIWDRIFGTFQIEEERPTYGLTKNINTFNPIKISFYEWQEMFRDAFNAPTLKTAINYIIMPPGWSHDGSRKTSKELQNELLRNKN